MMRTLAPAQTAPAASGPPAPGWGAAGGPHPALEALDEMAAAVGRSVQLPLWSLPDEGLLAALEAGEQVAAAFAAARLGLVREADGRDLASRSGAASAAALLRWQLRMTPAEAKARVDLAAALDGPLAATGAALAARGHLGGAGAGDLPGGACPARGHPTGDGG